MVRCRQRGKAVHRGIRGRRAGDRGAARSAPLRRPGSPIRIARIACSARTRADTRGPRPEQVTPGPATSSAARWRLTEPATCGSSGASGTTTAGISGAVRRRASPGRPPERLASDGIGYVSSRGVRAGRPDLGGLAEFSRRPERHLPARVLAEGSGRRRCSVSESPANDWEPAVAAGRGWHRVRGLGYVRQAATTISLPLLSGGTLSPVDPLTSSPKFQAHAAVAVDGHGRPWVAWDESGVNWGQGPGLPDPDAAWRRRLHRRALHPPGDCGMAAAWLEFATPR